MNSHHKKKIEKVLALTTHVDSTSTNTMQKNAVMNVLPTRTTSGPACFDEPRSELYLFGKDQRRVGVNSRKTNDGTTGTTMSEWVGATRWALGSMWNFLEDDQIAGGVEKLANGSKPRTSLLAMPLLSGIVQPESKERLEMIDEVVTPSEEWIVRRYVFCASLPSTDLASATDPPIRPVSGSHGTLTAPSARASSPCDVRASRLDSQPVTVMSFYSKA